MKNISPKALSETNPYTGESGECPPPWIWPPAGATVSAAATNENLPCALLCW